MECNMSILTPNHFKDHRLWVTLLQNSPQQNASRIHTKTYTPLSEKRQKQRVECWRRRLAFAFDFWWWKKHWKLGCSWIFQWIFKQELCDIAFCIPFLLAVLFAAKGGCWNHHQMMELLWCYLIIVIFHIINEGCRCHIVKKSGADDRGWTDQKSQFRGPNSTRAFVSPYFFHVFLTKSKIHCNILMNLMLNETIIYIAILSAACALPVRN